MKGFSDGVGDSGVGSQTRAGSSVEQVRVGVSGRRIPWHIEPHLTNTESLPYILEPHVVLNSKLRT